MPDRPDATGAHRRTALRRDARSSSRAPRSRASCAVCSTASTRCARPASTPTAGLLLVGGGARSRAYPPDPRRPRRPARRRPRRAASSSRPARACRRRPCSRHATPAEVAAAWGLGTGDGDRARGRRPRRGASALSRRPRTGSVDAAATADGQVAHAMDVADSMLDLVGNTPLVRLARLIAAEARVRPRRQGRDRQPGRQREGPRPRSR